MTKSDRCGHASSCHLRSLWSFHTSGSPPINTPPPPRFAKGGRVREQRECSRLTEEKPRTPPKHNPKSRVPKPKSYSSEQIRNDLGRSLLALLSWRTAILLDG